MKVIINKHWPIFASIFILWLTIGIILLITLKQNHGNLIYAIDDAYIHLSMAKHFAQYGVWGVTKYEFSSSSSSIIWEFLLSGIFFILGTNNIILFLLNVLLATLVILILYLFLYKLKIGQSYIFIILLLEIYLIPLPTNVFSGMEHILQTIITFLFFYYSAITLSAEDDVPKINLYITLILAPFVTLIRYEGLFIIMVVSFLFILRKRYIYSFSIGILGLLPIISYGVISISHGWFWLPNSIIVKSNTHLGNIIFYKKLLREGKKLYNIHLFVLLLLSVSIYFYRSLKGSKIWEFGQILLVYFISITILQLIFATSHGFWRYDAYLVALAIFIIALFLLDSELLSSKIPNWGNKLINKIHIIILILLIGTVVSTVYSRGIVSLSRTAQATTNIYEQQYQMGLFLKKYYQGKNILANDIGAINYLADIHCLDMIGLGSLEVAKMKNNHAYGHRQLYELAKSFGVQIAIVYDTWFRGMAGVPQQWIKVAEWKINNNVVCGNDTVSFYAVVPSEKDQLLSNIKEFAAEMPDKVHVKLFNRE